MAISFIPVDLENGPSTLEYDINIVLIQSEGRSGSTKFFHDRHGYLKGCKRSFGLDNGQYGRLMGLQVIDQNNHIYETKSLNSVYCGDMKDCDTKQV